MEISRLRKTRYYPELIPHTAIRNITAGEEASPSLLELRRFSPLMLRLAEYGIPQAGGDLDLRIRADQFRTDHTTAALPDPRGRVECQYTAFDNLVMDLHSESGQTDLQTFMSLWVQEPTVAHKIKYGKKLTETDKEIEERLNIRNSVEKGVLPLPIMYQLVREYHEVHKVQGQKEIALYAGERRTVDQINPPKEHFLVLTGVTTSATTAANNLRLTVDRDGDEQIVEDMRMFPHELSDGLSANCWIPATKELRLELLADDAITPLVRYEFGIYKMTNTMRVRFGLMGRDEAPGDLWYKVKGGIL